MKNPKIAHMLKYHRKIANLSVQDVSDKLKNYNIIAAPKTIYGWENGQTQPNADTLMILCKLYEIDDALYTFGYRQEKAKKIHLTDEEEKIIISYRLNKDMQNAVKKLLNLK